VEREVRCTRTLRRLHELTPGDIILSQLIPLHIFTPFSLKSISTSPLDGGGWSASRPCRFTPWEIAPGTHWVGCWSDHKSVGDVWREKNASYLPRIEYRFLGRPAHSQITNLTELSRPGNSVYNLYKLRRMPSSGMWSHVDLV
jgi:hypothetical protein